MNTEHPADMSPLSYGAGLALGLMLIVGLPAEKRDTSTPAQTLERPARPGCRVVEVAVPVTKVCS